MKSKRGKGCTESLLVLVHICRCFIPRGSLIFALITFIRIVCCSGWLLHLFLLFLLCLICSWRPICRLISRWHWVMFTLALCRWLFRGFAILRLGRLIVPAYALLVSGSLGRLREWQGRLIGSYGSHSGRYCCRGWRQLEGYSALFEGHDVDGTNFDKLRTMKHNVRSEKQNKMGSIPEQRRPGPRQKIFIHLWSWKWSWTEKKAGRCFPETRRYQTSAEKSLVSGKEEKTWLLTKPWNCLRSWNGSNQLSNQCS